MKWCLEVGLKYSADVPTNDDALDVSNSPVYIDASCNAIQHIAALLKDEELARLVNMGHLPYPLLHPGRISATGLTPASPQDIYRKIKDTLDSRLEELSEKDGEDAEFAEEWIRLKVGRSDVKKTIMTTPYGRTKYMNKEE